LFGASPAIWVAIEEVETDGKSYTFMEEFTNISEDNWI